VYDQSQISFIMQKKSEKIIELKRSKDDLLRKLYLSSIAFAIPFLWIVRYHQRYFPSFEDSGKLFPHITYPDVIALIASIATAVLMYYYTRQHGKVNVKYDALRHDIMDNIGTVICICHDQCNCREEYIKHLVDNGIDLVIR
jgi:hypothetical protein